MGVKKVPNPKMAAVDQQMARLLKATLVVGIPGNAEPQRGSKAPLWYLGYIHEFGCDANHIPPRPFLMPGIASVKDQMASQMRKAGALVLAGAPASEGLKGFHAAGLIAVQAVKGKIEDGSLPPLAASTLYKRKHRKKPPPNDRTSPLFDTGAMFSRITYAIDEG